ncbi:MAG: 50S ribosomal protein L1, partial [Sedimentisphaerales bacterium]
MAFRGKRYKKETQQLGREAMGLAEAVEKAKSFSLVKFDQTIECVLHLGIDPKQADQLIRGSVSLPHGIGKQKKVIAFCEASDVEAARAAGAIEVGCDELIKKISDGWLDFDVAVASPKVMGKVGKLGRILGPQGKMPSPKNGTITPDVTTAVAEFAAGKVEFRNDAGGNVHVVVGKQSFEAQKLIENI